MTRGGHMGDEQVRAIAEALDRGARALLEVAETAATALAQVFSVAAARAHAFSHSIMAALWRQYAEAGAPYGPTQEGLNRWLQEQWLPQERKRRRG